MNKHFQDTRYYLERAFQTTRAGLREELEPLRARVDALRGREAETEPTRLDQVRARVQELSAQIRTRIESVRRARTTQ